MPTIWITEDHALFRRATERFLSREGGFDTRGFDRCESLLSALRHGDPPDALLMDIGLPGMDGLSGITEVKKLAPELPILVLTVFEDDDKIFRAICAGATGYLLKNEPPQRVLEALREAITGGSPMNPRIARRVLAMFTQMAPVKSADYDLTERELAVLKCMVEGQPKKQIAESTGLNAHTADFTIRQIYKKLHVNCMAAAVSKAVGERLV